MSDVPPPGGYPQEPQPPAGGFPPPQPPPAPGYQPPAATPPYQAPPAQPGYQQPAYQQPGQFQPAGPPASNSGNGCLKAFLIIGGIGAVIAVIIVVASIFLVGSAVNEVSKNFGTADAGDYEITIDSCTVSSTGTMEADGSITNKAKDRHAYTIDVDFFDPNKSNLKLGGSSDWTSGLNEGQSEAWSVTSYATSDPAEVECKVGDVSYFGT